MRILGLLITTYYFKAICEIFSKSIQHGCYIKRRWNMILPLYWRNCFATPLLNDASRKGLRSRCATPGRRWRTHLTCPTPINTVSTLGLPGSQILRIQNLMHSWHASSTYPPIRSQRHNLFSVCILVSCNTFQLVNITVSDLRKDCYY